jgi:pyruvate formate lyase activating enzyme
VGLRFASFLYSSREIEGRWSLVLFLQGCNFRCRHCHNWRLVLKLEEERFGEDRVLEEVSENPFVDSVVITGGEPSLQSSEKMGSFLEALRSANGSLKIRIDTNGSRPDFLKEMKGLTDGFAVDIKAPFEEREQYSYTAGVPVDTEAVRESVFLAMGMPLSEFRTVSYPWLGRESIGKIESFAQKHSLPWKLNPFLPVPSCPFNR